MSDRQPHLHDADYPIDQHYVRGKFASQIGFMLAAVGSAIGLGNIWKFPYMVGENGGAAFILIYIVCIAAIGLPVLLVEFAVGRRGQTSAISSYRRIAPGTAWWTNGLLGILSAFVILAFYSAVAGWVLQYMAFGLSGGYSGFTEESAGDIFSGVINEKPLIAVLCQIVVMAITAMILYFGIEKGIERAAKYLMPLLFLLLILLMIRSVTLPGSGEGLAFLFEPEWGKINGKVILAAMGQAFFTLSIGMGAMITYASYVGKEVHLGKMGCYVAGLDTLIAILAGVVIFPAVFAYSIEPGGGPGLIFVTLPRIFAAMPAGTIIGTTFFFLVFIAALTSLISILEPVVTYLVDDMEWGRHKATAIAALAVMVPGIPAALSVGEEGILGEFLIPFLGGSTTFFDVLTKLTDYFLLPIGGLIACLFLLLGWNRRDAVAELAGEKGNPKALILQIWYWFAVTVAPLGVLAVIINGVIELTEQ